MVESIGNECLSHDIRMQVVYSLIFLYIHKVKGSHIN